MIVDRPGQSDRSVVTPVTGIIIKMDHFPGDSVYPGDVLYTIRLLSESLHQTQSELFKSTQDMKLAIAQRQRLASAGDSIPGARIIDAENQIARLEVAVKACQSELVNRGLNSSQIADVSAGKFVSEIAIRTPTVPRDAGLQFAATSDTRSAAAQSQRPAPVFEVQACKVELGQQVEAGQVLCLLANHELLAIEGRAFRDETPFVERSIQEKWPVDVDFQENEAAGWPALEQEFHIRHLANTIDPDKRTFAFRIPVENQSRIVEENGQTQILWRFRPGQRLRILMRVEKIDNVLILPAEAVMRDGVDAFAFTQNVNTFERQAVRILAQDRLHTVVANDGSLVPGSFVAQNAAAQLNRMATSQTSAVPKGYHIHADGSLHKNEDEVK